MKLLLDTNLLIWTGFELRQLSKRARTLIENPSNELMFSCASIWEMSIKRSYERRDFQIDIAGLRTGLLRNDYRELPITGDHAIAVGNLPLHHRDPFDRLLVAQASYEGASLLTADRRLRAYGDMVLIA